MTDLTRLRSLAESLNSPQSKRRETMAGVLYEARREVVEVLREMEAVRAEVIAECRAVALEERCERGTPWDLACTTIANKIAALAVKADGDRNE